MEEKSSDFEWDASKIVAGAISADKIVTAPQWELYPYCSEAVKERSFVDQINYYNTAVADYLDRETKPPPDTSWITTENLGERRSERRRKKPRNHPDHLQ